jgi:hypothetical protein
MARTAQNMTTAEVASLEREQTPAAAAAAPAPTYERKVFAIRLPDGRLQLISQ